MISIAVIEDEACERAKLRDYLARLAGQTENRINAEFFNGSAEFLTSCPSCDILLADIMLKDDALTGMDIALKWRESNRDGIIIFITNMAQFALQGYSVNALNFMVKPIDYSIFKEKLQQAFDILANRSPQKLVVMTRGGAECLNIDEIRYIETVRKGLILHMENREIYCGKTMKEMESLLENQGFFRCHKAYLVNLLHVRRVEAYSACIGNSGILVSRHRKRAFLDALVNYFGESVD